MRSQTIIAAAIAIAICLVSGALVYAAGKDGETQIKRVVRSGDLENEQPGETSPSASEGTIKSCGEEVGVGPETSCELGFAVWRASQGSSDSVVKVNDPRSPEELSLRCEGGGASAAVVCSGDDATVYLASR